jgi:hypothetical protein
LPACPFLAPEYTFKVFMCQGNLGLIPFLNH